MADLPTGTVTFLFTDIEGSTRLLHERGRDAYTVLLDEHRRLLRAAFEAANGVEIDTQGDAFFVAFPRARMAVAAAAAAQRALAAKGEVKVRMGIHTGDAELADGRYVGLAVVRAQRICNAGRGGQVLLSMTTRDVVEDDLPVGVRLRELGRIRLKDLERRELLFQLDIDGLPTSFARRKAAPQGRRWWPPALAVAVAALALGSAALIFRQNGSPPGLTRVEVNSIGVIDAGRNALVDQVTVGIRPTRIAAEPHGLWVVNEGDGTVSRVNAQTLAVTRTISTPGSTLDVAASADAVWVVGHQRRGNVGKGTALLYRIAPADAFVTNTTVIPSLALQGLGVTDVDAVGQSVWASGGLDVVRLRPATGTIAERVWEGGASDMAADHSSLWITQGLQGPEEEVAGRATRIDRATGSVTVTVPVGEGVPQVALGYGAAWIGVEGSVRRLDATSGVTVATIPIDGIVSDITVGAGAVWAADSSSGTVVRIDPKTNEVVETIRLGNRPDGIAFLDGKVYVTVY